MSGRSMLTVTALFVAGVIAGGTTWTAPAAAHDPCEEDECNRPPWYLFWQPDRCEMNPGEETACDVVHDGCVTKACYPTGGGGNDDEDEE